MLQVLAGSPVSPRFFPVGLNRMSDRAILDRATTIQVVTALADKVTLISNFRKIDLFQAWTGVQVSDIQETGDGEAVITLSGIPAGSAHAWGWLAVRLAGRQEPIKTADQLLINEDWTASQVRKAFLCQFCPSVCAGGTDLYKINRMALYMASPGYLQVFHPIFEVSGLMVDGRSTRWARVRSIPGAVFA